MSGGFGSLEGEGKQMALPQNVGRSCSLMSSGKRLIMCLHNEGSLNESIVVELHERAKWKRTTVDGTRSFTIPYPFFGAAGVLHPQDVAKLHLEDDPLGVLSRLNFVHTMPTFKRAREVEAAASVVAPGTFGLETSLSL